MANESKPIRKNDDGVNLLLSELVPELMKSFGKIDSYYLVKGTFVFLEFYRCENGVESFEPTHHVSTLFLKLNMAWEFASAAAGRFWLILYDDSRQVFRRMQVVTLTPDSIEFSRTYTTNLPEFREWFQLLNETVLTK